MEILEGMGRMEMRRGAGLMNREAMQEPEASKRVFYLSYIR